MLTRLRVRYSECDPMGVAHHFAYLPWLEIARTELLRASGARYADLEREGVLLAVVSLDIRYRRSARYDDQLDIEARIVSVGRVKIEHEYEVRLAERPGAEIDLLRAAGDDLLARARTTLACIDRDARLRPLPDSLLLARTTQVSPGPRSSPA